MNRHICLSSSSRRMSKDTCQKHCIHTYGEYGTPLELRPERFLWRRSNLATELTLKLAWPIESTTFSLHIHCEFQLWEDVKEAEQRTATTTTKTIFAHCGFQPSANGSPGTWRATSRLFRVSVAASAYLHKYDNNNKKSKVERDYYAKTNKGRFAPGSHFVRFLLQLFKIFRTYDVQNIQYS